MHLLLNELNVPYENIVYLIKYDNCIKKVF